MKLRKLKKVLSITLVSAMLITSVPMETFATEQNQTEQSSEQGSVNAEENGKTSDSTGGNTSEETGGSTGAGETGMGTGEAGGSTSEETGGSTGAGETGTVTSEAGGSTSEETGGSTGAGEAGTVTGEAGGSTSEETGGSTGEETSGSTGEETGGSTGEETGGSTGGETGGSTGGETSGSTGGETGGSTGGKTGGSTGGETDGSTGETPVETVAVSWSVAAGAELTWNGTNQAPTPTLTPNVDGISVAITCNGAPVTEAKEPGSYSAKVSIDGDSTNKKLENSEISFSIKKAPVSIVWENDIIEAEYTGEGLSFPKASFKRADGSGMLDANVAVTAEDAAKLVNGAVINAGDYHLVATLAEEQKAYYEIKNDGSASSVFRVKVPVTIDWIGEDGREIPYTGAEIQGISAEKALAADQKWFKVTTKIQKDGQSVEKPVDVGTYTVSAAVTLTDPEHYFIKNEKKRTFSIIGKEVTIQWSDLAVPYNGKEQRPTATFEGADGKEVTCKVLIDGEDKSVINVKKGGYAVSVNTSEYPNYNLKNSIQKFTIDPLEVTIDWKDDVVTYSGEAKKPTATFEGADGKKVTCKVLIDGEDKGATDAKKYEARVAESDHPNYDLTNPVHDFIISKLGVTIDWKDCEVTYNGEEHRPVATFVGADGKEVPCRVLIDGKDKGAIDAKKYEARVAESDHPNYDLTNPVHDFTISKLGTTITWDNCTVTYNGKEQRPTAKFVGADGKDVICKVLIDGEDKGATDAKKYEARVAESDHPNYDLTNPVHDFTISKLGTTITWDNCTVTYNGKEQRPTAKFVGADGKEVTCKVLIDGEDKGATDAKKYKASVNTDDHPNYTLENPTQEFTVNPLGTTITWDNCTVTYNGKEQRPTATFEGADGKEVTCKVLIDGEETGAIDVKEGGYEASVDPGEHSNYILENPTQKFTINPLETTIEWKDCDVTYNGAEQKPVATFVGADGKEVTCRVLIDGEETGAIDVKEGGYEASVNIDEHPNYILTNPIHDFKINPLGVKVKWSNDTVTYTYNGETQKPTASFTNIKNEEVSCDVSVGLDESGKDADPDGVKNVAENGASYTAIVTSEHPNYKLENLTTSFYINPLKVTVVPDNNANKIYYGQPIPKNAETGEEIFAYDVECENTSTKLADDAEGFKAFVKGELGESILYRKEKGEISKSYDLLLKGEYSNNYELSLQEGEHFFTIQKLPIAISAVKGEEGKQENRKTYGEKDPDVFAFVVDGIAEKNAEPGNIKTPTVILEELQTYEKADSPTRQIIGRVEENSDTKEDAIAHDLELKCSVTDNYAITGLNKGEKAFLISPLPVRLKPAAGQEKLFSQKDTESYIYEVIIKEGTQTLKKPEDVRDELEKNGSNFVLTREPGEAIGTYHYGLIPETSDLYAKTHYGNFALTVDQDVTYEIKPIKITGITNINSRQEEFIISTNLDEKVGRVDTVTTKFKIEVKGEFPVSEDGITFSQNIDDYITNATEGIVFTGEKDTIRINSVPYHKTRKDNNESLEWKGYLPAGTTIHVSIVDGNGVTVSDESKENQEYAEKTVTKVGVNIDWEGYKPGAPSGYYVNVNNGAVEPLLIRGNRENEWVELLYSKNGKGNAVASYEKLNASFTASVNNAGLTHVTQSVTANIVDTLNLSCESKSLQFYVDDSAFTIPASSIQFENRGKEITIRLPEMGTITSVSIPGAKVEIAAGMSQEFSFPVSWSGKDLIPTGSGITIEYTDHAGHQGTGSASASRSSVSTPITFRIRPELNANGYLNGRSSTLIVSGTACACEPIRVTAANMSQTTNATVKDTWSDSNGSWEVLFDMSGLPEDQDFTISAEYMDVNGAGYSISARFDAFCASPTMLSPVYEAMTHLSGMVEPGTAVALVVNGENQNYYEIQVDRFGHFVMDDVPMMFGGEDSFDIYVTDIAGNVSIRHYDIQEPGDPFEVTSLVNPLGKIFYSADENNSVAYAATPVSADDFEENKGGIKLPLLMGMSYEVGTLTLSKTENGFTVSSEIQMDEDIYPEDYRIENEKLYVYAGRPSIEDLRNHTGQVYSYGEEIPLAAGETVWIVDDKDMTILADDIMDLELFDFENSKEYVKYQEK